MLYFKEIQPILWFDIETNPRFKDFDDMMKKEPHLADIWVRRYHTRFEKTSQDPFATFDKHSAPIPEFAQVIAVSVGMLKKPKISSWDDTDTYISKGFYSEDEKDLLLQVHKTFNKGHFLGGFNIIGFDIPFMAKKYITHGILVPESLLTNGKKPWDLKHVDLMNVWKGTGFENTSFEAIIETLGVQSSKDEFDGSQIYTMYRKGEITLEDISRYCTKDVLASMCLGQRLCVENLQKPE